MGERRAMVDGVMIQSKRSIIGCMSIIATVAIFFIIAVPQPTYAATFTVTNTDTNGPGSFRQAILDANAAADHDTINFNIPRPGVHTITPVYDNPANSTSVLGLPGIESSMTIDGCSQPGSVCEPGNLKLMIEIVGYYGGERTANNIPSYRFDYKRSMLQRLALLYVV